MDTSQIISVAIFVVAMIAIMTEKVHRSLVAIARRHVAASSLHVMPFDQRLSAHIDFNTHRRAVRHDAVRGRGEAVGHVRILGHSSRARVAKGDPWTHHGAVRAAHRRAVGLPGQRYHRAAHRPHDASPCASLLEIDPVPFFMTADPGIEHRRHGNAHRRPAQHHDRLCRGLHVRSTSLPYDAPAVVHHPGCRASAVFYVMYGRDACSANEEHRKAIMELDENDYIKDRRLLHISVAMVVLVVVGFMTHGALGLESCGHRACRCRPDPAHLRREHRRGAVTASNGPRSCFFAGLFIIVGAMVRNGRHRHAGAGHLSTSRAATCMITMLAVLFGSAVISSFLDNIPFVATMIPIILTHRGRRASTARPVVGAVAWALAWAATVRSSAHPPTWCCPISARSSGMRSPSCSSSNAVSRSCCSRWPSPPSTWSSASPAVKRFRRPTGR